MSAHDKMVWLAWISSGAAVLIVILCLIPSPYEVCLWCVDRALWVRSMFVRRKKVQAGQHRLEDDGRSEDVPEVADHPGDEAALPEPEKVAV